MTEVGLVAVMVLVENEDCCGQTEVYQSDSTMESIAREGTARKIYSQSSTIRYVYS